MDCSHGVESPATLQLHKWDPSEFHLNLSDYREAFISPTRELLLLWTYQCEALLLPLVPGNSIDDNIAENDDSENVYSAASCLRPSRDSSSLDPEDDIPCTSASVLDSDNGFSFDHKFSRSNSHPFLCGVNSLAWGFCGDTYKQFKDASFRDLLFVSSGKGVTVHAFCGFSNCSTMERSMLDGDFPQGMWMDWGPSSLSSKSVKTEGSFRLHSDNSFTAVNSGNIRTNGEVSKDMLSDSGRHVHADVASKRWLRSFFTKAETFIADDNIWTNLPEKSSFPCSAKVVSFNIFDSNVPFAKFLSLGNSNSKKGDSKFGTVVDPNSVDLSDELHGSLSFDSFECVRVFSSSSHYLVGFVLTLADSFDFRTTEISKGGKINNLIIVARLETWRIQWVSVVNLDNSINNDSQSQWVDFSFSDELVVCLNSSGLIYFYAVSSGECVSHVDILQASVSNLCSDLGEQGKACVVADEERRQMDEVLEATSPQLGFSSRRKFRKLLIASHTSLVAAVDEHGVTYVMCAFHYLPDNYYTNAKVLPHLQHLALGMLVGWEVGGCDIGHQRVYTKDLSMSGTKVPSFYYAVQRIIHHWNLQGKGVMDDLWLNVFSVASKMAGDGSYGTMEHKHIIRRVFLPPEGFNMDDCIYFSPLGLTLLVRKNTPENRSGIVHLDLRMGSLVYDDSYLDCGGRSFHIQGKKATCVEEAVGCTFQGCFYLVTKSGLSVVLPSIFIPSNFFPVESIGYRQRIMSTGVGRQADETLEIKERKEIFAPWKLEVLDRVLLCDGPEESENLCIENGWELKISRLRRLQMALNYLKFNEIEQSLEMLVGVSMAEEGILRLLLAAVYLMVSTNGNDTDVSAASRLLTLGSCFTTKMIKKYGMLQHKKGLYALKAARATKLLCLPPALPAKTHNEMVDLTRLDDMAHFLEVIRRLQYRISAKFKKAGHGMVDNEESSLVDETPQIESRLSIPSADGVSLEALNQRELSVRISSAGANDDSLALVSNDSRGHPDSADSYKLPILVSQDWNLEKKYLQYENPKEMIARWKVDNLDVNSVVKDALLSGRLPLAVLQLHLHRSGDLDKEHSDTFSEVREIGRAIAYGLFLKGETGLAVTILHRLGEDIESCLKQILFGTVRRSLRIQVTEALRRYWYLGPLELKLLERISLIERLYPSSSFWKTFLGRHTVLTDTLGSSTLGEISLGLLHPHLFDDLVFKCGEIDGVVLGIWRSMDENSPDSVMDEDNASAGYWAAAVVWASAWDDRTFDRIVLDQPFLMGVHMLWESQVEYHICHNDWEEVAKLLDLIPQSHLSDGALQIALDDTEQGPGYGYGIEHHERNSYICSLDELDAVCMDVPGVRIFRLSINVLSSTWLKKLIEQELAKKFIFLKVFWESMGQIMSILARSGFITGKYDKMLLEDNSTENFYDIDVSDDGTFRLDAVRALHKLVVHHCVQQNLPNFLELYLDHHKLALDDDSLHLLIEAAGDCQWAKWLLFSRIRGREYDASFCNARSITRNLISDGNLNDLDVDDVIVTVDDIAEGGGEMAALATLMYAPDTIQKCLSSGSVNRLGGSSTQCTLENLRPLLQRFPTLWRSFVAATFGQETNSMFPRFKANNVLANYLNWRDSIFFSASRDTSLLQMLPCWFPKTVRRLIQLYIQGPLGWQLLSDLSTGESLLDRDIDFYIHTDEHAEISAITWEATIQKHVQEELYDSSLEESGHGLEHHLHRGRALAAFNSILGARVQKLKLESSTSDGQTNVQLDVQTLLAPLEKSEEPLLSSVIPLAITHFEDPVLVASCAFLLELCGLSASILRVDVAALRRVSSFYRSGGNKDGYSQFATVDSTFHMVSHKEDIAESLAQSLADEYLHRDYATEAKVTSMSNLPNGKPSSNSRALMLVLQHLEKASLPVMTNRFSCGSWLLTDNGDGLELRSQQKAASQHWNLVTVFCQMHDIPLSTKYLAVLARDNDWVGFLTEAQIGGYPFDSVVEVATREFTDPRLRIHILTVLRNMQSKKKAGSPMYSETETRVIETSCTDNNLLMPVELFRILADSEKLKDPGEAILRKAKEMSWSILAMIASCFPDVSPLSCLTVWLEITAARETSSIKVNDVASRIAENVGAAVDATNSLPACIKSPTIHYNRQNPKRRRLIEPESADTSVLTDTVSPASDPTKLSASQGATSEELEVCQWINASEDSNDGPVSLSKMVAVLCEQQLFLPLLRAFELFLPSCSLLPFFRALQAFSQMRLSEASAHLGSFSARIKEESSGLQSSVRKEEQMGPSWASSIAIQAANAVLSTCPSPYEKRCLLQLLASTDFGDGGSAAAYYRRLHWKINLAEPLLRKDDSLHLGNETLDDASLLTALENNGHWEEARNWARHLEGSGGPWKFAVHHVTETQAESMVAEWKEFLWDVPEERVTLWSHCQTLFIRYSFPPLQAGLFFLKHAEAVEKDLPARELLELLLLSLQWLSGMITLSNPVYPMHLLREIETRVWLLAVESEAQVKNDGNFMSTSSSRDPSTVGNISNIVDRTASLITKMDNHINSMRSRTVEKYDTRENTSAHTKNQVADANLGGPLKTKRRVKGYVATRRSATEPMDRVNDSEDAQLQDENLKIEMSLSKWEERVGPAELERAVLSLLEFGQITAAKQLQDKLSPEHTPPEFKLVDAALKLAAMSVPKSKLSLSMLDEEVCNVIESYNISTKQHLVDPLQVLESLSIIFVAGNGRGLCKRIIAVVEAANVLGLTFSEAFDKQPIELLQLLSLKAQESFEEASLLVQTHSMPASSIAQILAESFLKGILAAHRGGYIDSQKEEGPAPLLWRFSDFLKWAELCPSEPEIGHALMRLVITGQEIPHACEVELLILSHHFYKSSACLDGVDVLVALAATRVEAYVSEGDFACLARLITGVGNFHALNFILGILIENGQLDLLLQKYSAAADTNTATAEAVRGFRMAVLTALKHFNPKDIDAFAMVYNHFDMKHETAALLESRAWQSSEQWFDRYDKDQNEDLLEAMRHFIEAAEVHSSIDAGNKTCKACANASLVSLQIRMPDSRWLGLSETNARRLLVEQSRFQEALIVAEAYGLNQASEWALVLWNQMLKPELTEEFVAEFVAVLPLQPSMLIELARFYRAEVAARGDQSQFSVWLTGGGLPAEWAKYLGRSFRCLLKRTRDLRLTLQLATIATGFSDIVDASSKALDKVPENAGPLVLRRGHGGAYLPLM